MKKVAKLVSLVLVLFFGIILFLGGGFGTKDYFTIINNGKPIIFAHRGVADINVENSAEAFLRSKAMGFNAIETDISCTKDGKLVIFHDDNCERLLGIDSDINELNWADINDKYLLYNSKTTANKVLSLEQFLQQSNPKWILYLDIKETKISIADSLLSILNKYKKHENIIIADANIFFLAYLKYQNSNIKTGLEGFNKGKEWIYYIIPKNFKPDYYSSFLAEVDERHMLFLKDNSLINRKIVYGVDHTNLSKVYDLGIQNIIFDYSATIGKLEKVELNLEENKITNCNVKE